MPSIFISGIPKGLDRRIVSLRIRKDIETVAQVKTIEIQNEKGYGFVSLLDETSADFVLSLNKKIFINGNPLRIRKWRVKSRFPNTSRRTTFPLCKEQVNNDVFVLRGYDTYTNYKRHRPQTDVLYQYIQQPPRQKKVKRKPWKNINRLSQQPSPKSRKTVRTKKRKSKKKTTRWRKIKQSTSSSKEGLYFVYDGQKRTKFHSACEDDCLSNNLRPSKKLIRTKNVISTEVIGKNALQFNQLKYATVHVYDHSKLVCNIEVDNNNLLESIRDGLKNTLKIPTDDTVLITHNGKAVNSQWQPKMENDDNIHIIVKGKGGMMQGDPPDKNDGNDRKKTTKDNFSNETNDSQSTRFSAYSPGKDLGDMHHCAGKDTTIIATENPKHELEESDKEERFSAEETYYQPEQEIENRTEEETVDKSDGNGIINTTCTGSDVDESSGTEYTINDSIYSGSTLDESLGRGSDENEFTGTGSREEESSGTGCHEDKSTGKGSLDDESSANGSREDNFPGTGSRADKSPGTGSREDKSASTGPHQEESAGTGSREDESPGTGSREDKYVGTGSREDQSPCTGSRKDKSPCTGSREEPIIMIYQRSWNEKEFRERNQHLSGDATTIHQTEDDIISMISPASNADESVFESVQDVQNDRLLLQEAIKSSPFGSTFLQGSEAYQAKLVDELGLSNYFPEQLTYVSVMSINDNEKDEADTLADIPKLILRKLIMLDFTSREHDLDECLLKMKEEPLVDSQECKSSMIDEDFLSLFDSEDPTDESSLNFETRSPVDIFLSIFICLHPTLKQKVCLKMFSCHLAMPIIFPIKKDENQEETLSFSILPLRLITVHDGQRDTSLINCKQNIVSFVRLGRPQISKSKLANEILYETAHNAFFNYDCVLGSHKKQASVGLVEGSWFLPSPKQKRKLENVTLFLNLRGDVLDNAQQIEYLKRVSRVMIIVTDKDTLKHKKQIEYFKFVRFNVVFVLTGNVSTKFISTYKQWFMSANPDGFNAEFISVSKQGQNIGMSEIQKKILDVIEPWLNNMTSANTLLEISNQARAIGITVDEDMPIYRKGRKQANMIFDMVKDYPLAGIKTNLTPLQKQYWNDFTIAMKKFRKPGFDIHEKEKFKREMEQQRKQQWDVYKSGNQFMKDFIKTFLSLDGDSLVAFLDTLKFELDENFRKNIPKYRANYAAAWDTFQKTKPEDDKAKAGNEVRKTEQKLSEASFGIEHVFRELGQIYEASLIRNASELGSNLAKTVAKSISLGYPFELMDGDVANVPLGWVKQIFEELKNILGDVRLLTLTVLGLQSSGKSTLLNAMFGLTFTVSAGRCTRGIYLQLFPVQKGKFNFDYLLVVDTEGLRAPELGEIKQQHDNELATLVIGMADITIVNIKGENTSEVKDILQICIHAFFQLKMANESLHLHQSCIFIHQNVSDVGAKDAMIHARKKLDETLDRMTLEAAEEENLCGIKCFKDVIHFDSNKHVWYFSDLWKGDPPMAPANPGYSQDVQKVKSFIFETLVKHRDYYLSISDTFVHINDLWNGILANDFVFSFRNTLEIKAYNTLETKYQDLIWNLERFTKKLTKEAEGEIKQCTAQCEKDNVNDRERHKRTMVINERYLDMFTKKESELKMDLRKYFDESDKRDEIEKWKESKLCSWDILTERYLGKLNRQLMDIESNCKVDYTMNTTQERLKKDIYDQAQHVAEEMKGKNPSQDDMRAEFDEMWDKWIRTLDVQDEKAPEIEILLEKILYDIFAKNKSILQTELQQERIGHNQPFNLLERSLNNYKFNDNDVSVERSIWKTLKDGASQITNSVVNVVKSDTSKKKGDTKSNTLAIDDKTNVEVIRFTNVILRDIDVKLGDLQRKDWKFDATKMKEIPICILQHIKDHNEDAKKTFKLLKPFEVKLCVHAFRLALPLLETKDAEYRNKHGIKAKLARYKSDVWSHFNDVVEEKSASIIASDRFCEVIRKHVEEKVKINLTELIHQHIVNDFSVAKFALIAAILEDLAKMHNLNKYIHYIHNSHAYTFKWLTEFINNKCFGRSGRLYMEKASAELQVQFSDITKCVKENSASCLNDWLTNVQNGIKQSVWIQIEAFSVVKDQKVTDLNGFKTVVEKKLKEIEEELSDKFGRETASTIQWSSEDTPYELCMKKLWGCKAMCPFCKEPCKEMCNDGVSTHTHSCIQHRAEGVSGGYWKDSNILLLESCSFHVQYTAGFRCRNICEGSICNKGTGPETFHPYRDYKKYIPEWNINPCSDISSSKYWAWVLCTFNDEFARYYGKKKANIPKSWEEYTKNDAIKSLREYH